MPSAAKVTDVASGLLARAILYQWAARLFAYPDDHVASVLAWDYVRSRPLAAAAVLDGDQRAAARTLVEATAAAWEGSRRGEISLAADYTFLFAREVQAPPYEGRYRPMGGLSLGQELSDVASYYAAFGFQVSERAKERQDHIALELEFLAALYAKEVYALEQGWAARARTTRRVREKFVREHVASWTEEFAGLVREKGRLAFYPALCDLVCALVKGEKDH